MSGSTGPFDWSGLVLGPCQDVFGESLTWVPSATGKSVTVRGIFDAGFRAFDIFAADDGAMPSHISQAVPVLGVRQVDFPGEPMQGDLLIIRNNRYRIKEVRPDSHGAISLTLNRADAENGTCSGRTS